MQDPEQDQHDLVETAEQGSLDGQLIAAVSYVQGKPPKALRVDEIGAALLNPRAMVWIGLHHPDKALMTQVLTQLDVSLDSLGALLGDLSMPRLSVLEREMLLVVPTIVWKSGHSRPHFGRLACLVGERVLVTVRRGSSVPHGHLRERLENNRSLLEAGCDHVAVEIIDDLIDRYVEAYHHFETLVDRSERELMRASFDRVSIQRLYMMRRDFHRLQVAVEPIGEICARVAKLQGRLVGDSARLRFEGLTERISRVDGLFDSLAEGLKFAFEAGMLIEQSRQTDTTRKLASWAAIISIPTAMAGIYGMNFENMPELKWEYGYYVVLGLMATACTTLYALFKRSKWL